MAGLYHTPPLLKKFQILGTYLDDLHDFIERIVFYEKSAAYEPGGAGSDVVCRRLLSGGVHAHQDLPLQVVAFTEPSLVLLLRAEGRLDARHPDRFEVGLD